MLTAGPLHATTDQLHAATQGTCKDQTVVATAHVIITRASRLGLRSEPLFSRRPWLSL